jgi:hypothetical protein
MPEYYEFILLVRGTAATNIDGAGACLHRLAEELDVDDDVWPRLTEDGATYFSTPFRSRLPAVVVWLAELSAQFPGCCFQALYNGPFGVWGTGTIDMRDGKVARADLWPHDEWGPEDHDSTVQLGTGPDGAPALVCLGSGVCAGPGPADVTTCCQHWLQAHAAEQAARTVAAPGSA